MGFRLRHIRVALAAVTLLLATAPEVFAKPAEPQENSLQLRLERLASVLKAEGERAIAAAANAANRAWEENKDTVAEVKTGLAARLESFGKLLNEQKARLATLGEDAAARIDAWRQAASSSWAEIHRSATEALDWFQGWIAKQSVSDEPSETRV